MGGWISNLSASSKDVDEENLRKYQETLDADETLPVSDELDKRKVLWWERLIFDRRLRISYVLTLGVLVGIFVPLIIWKVTNLDNNEKTIYGSCLINNDARFECLINSAKVVDEEACTNAFCCWENSNDLLFKCYHSLPSAYQYFVSDVQSGNTNGTDWTKLQMSPNHKNLMSNLQVLTYWENRDHLVVELFNPSKFPGRSFTKENNGRPSRGKTSNGNSTSPQEENNEYPLDVSWGNKENFFYIRIGRTETDETIFDTRLGPIILSDNYISLATVLPTPYFYGLKGGQGSASTVTYGIVNGFESSELPFYISSEKSGRWHGVFIDTTEPMLVQTLQAPGIMFYLETELPEINVHFFSGPTQPDILRQLHAHIQRKHNINHKPMIPPYWGLGLHLCRKVENGSVVIKEIEELVNGPKGILYDSDCVDEYLRHPVDIDETRFDNINTILELLESKSKKILLSQKVTEPWDQNTLSNNAWLLDTSNSSDITYFFGEIDNATVKYIDFFNPNLGEFPRLPTNPIIGNFLNGLSLSDNFPKLYNASETCGEPKTRLQSLFTSPMSSTVSLNSSYFWGSVCPEVMHNISIISDGTNQNDQGSQYSSHFRLHNSYGQESLKTVYKTLTKGVAGNDMMITSSSIWTSSLYYGGFNGLQVPFSWKGLQDSVTHTVRNYALLPVSSSPICGSMTFNMTIRHENELCLRWFQFGLLLPIARNSYDNISAFGPLQFSDLFKGYLNETIKKRYSYAPYYFTTLEKYQSSFIPMITPMSFYFDNESDRISTLPLLNQFMIGEALLAAPIMDIGLSRSVYFPTGTWYSMYGIIAYSNGNVGSFSQITGHITETPMFLRGGHTIPTLQKMEVISIEESLKGDYTLIAALSSKNTSSGTLTVEDAHHNKHLVNFMTIMHPNDTLTVLFNATANCEEAVTSLISTTINEFRIFGFPAYDPDKFDVTVEPFDATREIECRYNNKDKTFLRILKININWCTASKHEMTVRHIQSEIK